jgi:ATP-binding cassette subfamily B protein
VNPLDVLYDVDGGAIRVDGVDVRDLKRGALRRIFGMALQDTWRSARFARTSPTAASTRPKRRSPRRQGRAGRPLHPTLPENYDTPINEEASTCRRGRSSS